MRSERFDFPNASGTMLAGRLELPSGAPAAVAIFAHCFTCSKNIHAATRVSRELAARGIAVLRFDFTGLGGSDGDFANANLTSNVSDLVAAADALRQRYQAPSLLIGHSLGGTAVLLAASRIPEIRTIATIAAPSEPEHLADLLRQRAPEIEAEGAADITLGGHSFRIGRDFLEDLRSHALERTLPDLGKPLMILHSPIDRTVPIDHARRLYQWAKHPKSFISLDGADHLLTEPEDAAFVASMLTPWAMRYIPEHEQARAAEQSRSPQPEPEHGVVRVTERAGFAQEILAGPHHLAADEPIKAGGTDTGPTPHELLLAGLGACTSMTVRLYADRKKWPLTGVSVTLRRSQLHEADAGGKPHIIENIQKELTLLGDLDLAQKQRLMEIADRCPVHRTLLADKRIHTQLAPESAE